MPAARFDDAKHGKTSGAVISAMGRAPIAGRARLNSHSTLLKVRRPLPSRRFLSRSSAAMASKVLALAVALAALASFFDEGRVLAIGQKALGVFRASLAS